MESIRQDLRFAVKLLLKDRGFNIAALLTLALCIGANTSIFSVIHSVILKPLPYPESGRLVMMYNCYPGVGVKKGANGVPDYLDRRQETGVFEDVTLIGFAGYDIGIDGTPERAQGLYVTPSMFRVLRVSPALGRVFAEDEAKQGNDKVAILSHGLWKRMFAGDAAVLGKEIRLNGVQHKIVGVMPDGFQFLSRDAQLWVPFAFTPQQTSDDARHSNSWSMVARLKPGVTLAQAQERINALNQRNLERFPKLRKLIENARFNTKVVFLQDELVDEIKTTLWLVQGAVFFVLLIGCVNVANLMLVRSNVRMKELAVRFGLGAGQWRLARQLLTENVVLAVLGGMLGMVVGYWGIQLLRFLGSEDLPRGKTIGIDGTVLAFTLSVSVATGLLFGSVPVLHLFHRNLSDVFRQTERTGTAERRALITRAVLVVCQVSLAFVLLIGAGLMIASFYKVLKVDPGFRGEQVATARLVLPRSRYAEDARALGFLDRALESARALPAVKSAGLTNFLPFSGNNNASVITIVGYNLGSGENPPVPGINISDGRYFEAMGIPLLRGRLFQDSDGPDSEKVAIIDQFLARKYWPDGNPLGAKIRRGIGDFSSQPYTIIGVVGSVKVTDLADQNPVGVAYFHYRQLTPRGVHLVVKTLQGETAVVNALRTGILRLDSELPLSDIKTMSVRVASSLSGRRAAMVLCSIFAGLALLLSAIGIYGVLSYAVTQRTREFGIRIAIGAQPGDVVRMVFWHGLRLALIGLAIGLAAAFSLNRVLASQLYEVKATDPAVFVLVSLVLATTAFLAALLPSLRATRISPVVALRYE